MTRIERGCNKLDRFGFGPFATVIRMMAGGDRLVQARVLGRTAGLPLLGFGIFLLLWAALAAELKTSIGSVPGPVEVWHQAAGLVREHRAERQSERYFYARQAAQEARYEKAFPGHPWQKRVYSGAPTYLDQIETSLETVFAGFVIASLVAVPLGILCGLSRSINAIVNPFVQLFRPVSPLAWLPIVMILVSGLYVSKDPIFPRSFVSSAITVALCSLWPTLLNTAIGVGAIEPDHLNVAKVLRLSWSTRLRKIILPSTLPYIFTGLRLSLGVGWMVLIAAEMLSQNPGLGKFVWDMFQNGSSETLALIIVAVFTIGGIGFVLDRLMLVLQQLVSHDPAGRR